MLINGSCRISRPLGDEKQLRTYLAKRQLDKLAARLETDAKALFLALHQYGKGSGLRPPPVGLARSGASRCPGTTTTSRPSIT